MGDTDITIDEVWPTFESIQFRPRDKLSNIKLAAFHLPRWQETTHILNAPSALRCDGIDKIIFSLLQLVKTIPTEGAYLLAASEKTFL
ncbi:hypothetical protein ACU8KH_04179 [Lachancea thermotolerans]